MTVSNEMSRRDRRSSSWGMTQGLRGAVVGLVIGVVATTESLITQRFGPIPQLRQLPGLLTVALLLGLGLTWLVVASRNRLFSQEWMVWMFTAGSLRR